MKNRSQDYKMKKILAMFILFGMTANAVEIFDEFYVMEKTMATIEKSAVYDFNGIKVKAAKVDSKILKSLATTDDPFYFYDSNKQKTFARRGDYLISPLTFSEIYSVDAKEFEVNFIKE